MSRVAITTTDGQTVWKCDRCGELVSTPSAFHIPDGWWKVHVERRTEGGKAKAGDIDACSKDCLLEAITYQNQHLVDYV